MRKSRSHVSPAFQFYPKEWLSSAKIAMMTPAQEGGYLRLLAYAWLDPECSIPNDPETLSRLSRLDWDKGGYQMVTDCFTKHPSDPTRLVNIRLLKEREKQARWREKSAEGGRKSAQKRWSGSSLSDGKGGYKMVTQCLPNGGNQSVTLQSPVSSLQSPNKYHADAPRVLALMNEISGRGFRECPNSMKMLSQRLSEDQVTLDGVQIMMKRQYALWKGTEMEDFFRPKTLFNKTNFDNYYGQKDAPIHRRDNGKPFDRNKGTYNEGNSQRYSLEAIQKSRELQRLQRPGAEKGP